MVEAYYITISRRFIFSALLTEFNWREGIWQNNIN